MHVTGITSKKCLKNVNKRKSCEEFSKWAKFGDKISTTRYVDHIRFDGVIR